MENSGGISTPNILTVDDSQVSLQMLTYILKGRGYKVRPVTSGKLAVQTALANPPDLILLDITMPEMDGFEVCKRLKATESLKNIPVIFISGISETLDKVKAFSVGGIDYITKPFQVEEVEARVDTQLKLRSLQRKLEGHNHHLQQMVLEQVKDISNAQLGTIIALVKLAEYRDEDTGNHIIRMQSYCKALASRLAAKPGAVIDDDYVKNIYYASAMHDIGKVAIPDCILLKPGTLTEEEFDKMKTHTVLGAETLAKVYDNYPNVFVKMGMELAQSHHERWDGSGYPDGLSGEAIPLSARITMLADHYDVMRSVRPYKKHAFDAARTYAALTEGDGRTMPAYFDPGVLEAFKEIADEFEAIHDGFQG